MEARTAYFRAQSIGGPVRFPDGSMPVRFDLSGPHHIRVTIEPYRRESAPSPEEVVRGPVQVLCTVIAEHSVDAAVLMELESLTGNADRSQALVALEQQVFPEMRNDAERTFRLLRWRQGSAGDHRVFTGALLPTWSHDGENWDWFPQSTYVRVVDSNFVAIDSARIAEVATMIEGGEQEPLAHELFREAWAQKDHNPRSALVIAIAAAETGLKDFIAKVAPDTSWLLNNAPSPPIRKIMRDYVPIVMRSNARRASLPAIPPVLIKGIEGGVEWRNRLSHTGRISNVALGSLQNAGRLREILSAVRDLLWILDYYSGHEWAIGHLTYETRQAFRPSWPLVPASLPQSTGVD